MTYLRILRLAARTTESEVSAVLELLLATPGPCDKTDVERLDQPEAILVPQLVCGEVHMQQYDRTCIVPLDAIRTYRKALRLPTARAVEHTLTTDERENWPLETFLQHLLEQEMDGRRERRITRLTKAAHLPAGKTLDTFDQQRLPLRVRRQLPQLCRGDFIARAENILIFGLPGTGKTHLAAALGYEWAQRSCSVLITPSSKLVGQLLRARRDYEPEPESRRLDRFQVIIVDDLGHVQRSRQEMDVLCTFLAERYERRSVVITSNLVFSEWDQIFKDPLTTADAIDRVVHHSLIIEFGREMKSVRADEAARHCRIRVGSSDAAQDAEG